MPRLPLGGPRKESLAVAALSIGAAILLACSSTPDEAVDANKAKHEVELVHEACDTGSSSAQKVDANGDGRPDIIHVMSGSVELCRVADLNMDGRNDVFIYFDEAGNERRREYDFDRDGRPDEIDILKGGVIVEKDREMNFDGKLDTWDYYEGGKLKRRERDTNADGIVDQWWDFYDPNNPKCARVANDLNQDGEPDPSTAVDLCKEDQAIAAPPAVLYNSASASASAPPPPAPSAPPPPPPTAPPAPPAPSAAASGGTTLPPPPKP